jgi:hypothetical protein
MDKVQTASNPTVIMSLITSVQVVYVMCVEIARLTYVSLSAEIRTSNVFIVAS